MNNLDSSMKVKLLIVVVVILTIVPFFIGLLQKDPCTGKPMTILKKQDLSAHKYKYTMLNGETILSDRDFYIGDAVCFKRQ